MWRNYLPIPINPAQSSEEENYESTEEPDQLVSPRRPHQSPTASPRALLQPDPPAVEEVLAGASNYLRNLPNRRPRNQPNRPPTNPVVPPADPPPVIMPDQIISFEDQNGVDEAGAMREACRNVEKMEWDDNDVAFFFSKIEIKMSAVGVKKQYTKFQVLSTVLPKKVEDQMKPLLIKTETEFPQQNAYKILKRDI